MILTRADPVLPRSRQRVRKQLTELRATDLRFALDEAVTFPPRAMGLSLTPEQIASLDSRTEDAPRAQYRPARSKAHERFKP